MMMIKRILFYGSAYSCMLIGGAIFHDFRGLMVGIAFWFGMAYVIMEWL